MTEIFIDGSAGTTGLQIYDRIQNRADFRLITLPETERKDPQARKWVLNHCDAAFLCLPDEAARQAVQWVENEKVVLLDTSTAHRTQSGWAYGFAELGKSYRQAIQTGKRIAVPGCHASGFIALVKPLIDQGLLSPEGEITCHSVTGYSGGGKKMIAQYEEGVQNPLLCAPRQYGLEQHHKHLPEMQTITGLQKAPVFCPIVSNFYSGMVVTVPLFASQLQPGVTSGQIQELYREFYQGPVVQYRQSAEAGGFFSAAGLSGKDTMELTVAGNEERILLMARYDNLGKGASGAAVQCLNLALGLPETMGLLLS